MSRPLAHQPLTVVCQSGDPISNVTFHDNHFKGYVEMLSTHLGLEREGGGGVMAALQIFACWCLLGV